MGAIGEEVDDDDDEDDDDDDDDDEALESLEHSLLLCHIQRNRSAELSGSYDRIKGEKGAKVRSTEVRSRPLATAATSSCSSTTSAQSLLDRS